MNSSVLCFGKTPFAKKSMDKRGGGGVRSIKILLLKFLSHSAEKFRRGNPLLFH